MATLPQPQDFWPQIRLEAGVNADPSAEAGRLVPVLDILDAVHDETCPRLANRQSFHPYLPMSARFRVRRCDA